MNQRKEKSPVGREQGFLGAKTIGGGLLRKSSTPAPVLAFKRELWIILNAAHCMAAGHGLNSADYDRLHEAHQHVIRVLDAMS